MLRIKSVEREEREGEKEAASQTDLLKLHVDRPESKVAGKKGKGFKEEKERQKKGIG